MTRQAIITVDARGLRCPLPVLRLAKAGRDLPPGTVIELLADDAAARTDVPAFVTASGWGGVSLTPAAHGATLYHIIR